MRTPVLLSGPMRLWIHVAKVRVAGSSPVIRSKKHQVSLALGGADVVLLWFVRADRGCRRGEFRSRALDRSLLTAKLAAEGLPVARAAASRVTRRGLG